MGKYFEYQLTGLPNGEAQRFLSTIEDDIVVNDWHKKARRLQSRRWKRILRNL